MNPGVEPVVMDVHLPAGVAGPDPLDFDVRCFLVPHAVGVVLIDTCLAGSNDPITFVLKQIGADWRDITDIVLTHNHPDHTGGLAEVMARTDGAVVWAGAEDRARIPFDGQLRTLAVEAVALPTDAAGVTHRTQRRDVGPPGRLDPRLRHAEYAARHLPHS